MDGHNRLRRLSRRRIEESNSGCFFCEEGGSRRLRVEETEECRKSDVVVVFVVLAFILLVVVFIVVVFVVVVFVVVVFV